MRCAASLAPPRMHVLRALLGTRLQALPALVAARSPLGRPFHANCVVRQSTDVHSDRQVHRAQLGATAGRDGWLHCGATGAMSLVLGGARELARLVFVYGEGFEWRRGVTPLSAPAWPLAGMAAYLIALAPLKAAVAGRPVPIPTFLTAAHNLFLCLASAVMFAGCLSAVVEVR